MRAFVDYSIQPHYGNKSAVVRWSLASGFESSEVFVYRSYTGVKPWELLNGDSPSTTGEYLDTDMEPKNLTEVPFYKLLAKLNGELYPSELFRPFDQLTRMEYGACRQIMHKIYVQLSRADGLPMFLLKARKVQDSGLPHVDEETGQLVGPPCDDDADYAKLFDPPVQTWVKLSQADTTTKEAADAMGLEDTTMRQGDTLGFPYPRHGDLFVHPALDDRYVVAKAVPQSFKGLVPVTFKLALSLLSRDDKRYKVDVPVYKRELPR